MIPYGYKLSSETKTFSNLGVYFIGCHVKCEFYVMLFSVMRYDENQKNILPNNIHLSINILHIYILVNLLGVNGCPQYYYEIYCMFI